MPLDPAVIQEPSKLHNSGDAPYQCSSRPRHASGVFVDYGYCRHSLDVWPEHLKQGSSDKRCPKDCPNKAPMEVAIKFQELYSNPLHGNKGASDFSRQHREQNMETKELNEPARGQAGFEKWCSEKGLPLSFAAEAWEAAMHHAEFKNTQDAENARRYLWLAPRLMEVDFDWNETGKCALIFEGPRNVGVGGNFDKNIDASMEQ